LVEEELFVKNADKQKIENDSEFQKALKEMVDLVTRSLKIQFSEKKIYDGIQVSAEQSKDYFEKNKERYVKVAGGTLVNGIKFDTDAAAAAFLIKAKANVGNFEKLAKQDKAGKFREFGRVSKESNGLGTEAVPAPIKETVLSLPNLPAVEKIKVGKEIWVVKASDKKDSVYFEFDKVKPQVEAMIKNNDFRDKLANEITKLKSEYKVTVNEDFFKEKQPDATQTAETEKPADQDSQGEAVKAEAQPQQAPQAA
jgi:peptidyl-prolyl cis-trans isomerase C